MNQTNKHEFALFFSELATIIHINLDSIVVLEDVPLCHRVLKVLRLNVGEKIILFDREHHVEAEIMQLTKRTFSVRLLSMKKNKKHDPEITFLLPLLKRADLESAIYSLVELGVNVVQLVTTQKTGAYFHGEKEFQRLHNIIIAAAEQSKNFSIPQLHAPINFIDAVAQVHSPFIFFDPQGMPLLETLNVFVQKKPTSFTLMIGPEGDLTEQEKDVLKQNGALFCQLTPTVLRSVQAAGLSAGIIRSCF